MNNPEYAMINGKKYKINTDYRVGIKCNEIATDDSITDYERGMAIIYTLYGDEGLKNRDDYEELLKKGIKFLSCGEELQQGNEKPNMDLQQDYRFIQASFRTDYGINLDNENMHWYDFISCLNGLTDKCILSRIRELRDMDISKIKDAKEQRKISEMQQKFALKKRNIKKFTEEENENIDNFYKAMGIEEGGTK